MGWRVALIVSLLPLIALAVGVTLPRKPKKPVIRSDVGGVWMMNKDWNIRSRK